jgi:glycosyltransferase involved in cell wall biosynthesis
MPGYLCDSTICVSEAIRGSLIDDYRYPARKVITIRNGVDLTYYARNPTTRVGFREALGWSEDCIFLCISRLVPQKRLDLLLEAMGSVKRRCPTARCLIVGEGFLFDELDAMTRRLGVESAVRFVGGQTDVRPYLGAADVFVLPSEREGLSLVLLEAMAQGLPCIAASLDGNREVIVEGDTGLLVPIGSVDELAEAMIHLSGLKEKRVRMGANSVKRVRDHFDIEGSLGKIVEVILGASKTKASADLPGRASLAKSGG